MGDAPDSASHVPSRPLRIGSELVETDTWREVRSPYDGGLVGRVAYGDARHARRAIDAAAAAMSAPMARHARAELLERIATLVAARRDQLATSICDEAGKPISMARLEVDRAVGTFEAAAVAARTLVGEQVPMDAWASGAGHVGWTVRCPVGVVGAITPFNFPLNLVAHKVAPAIAAGCGIVLKPAEKTPLTALLLAELVQEAGLPDGRLNVVVGEAAEIAEALCDDPRVRLITFTGSTSVGQALSMRARYAQVMLELGNATPVIVHLDADVADAVARIVPPAFGFGGQSCVSPQRLFVHRDVADDVRARLVESVARLGTGAPRDDAVTVGPLITADAHDRVLRWIDEATTEGARVLAGGATAGNNVVQPTLLDGVTPAMRVWREEVFGPVLAVMEYDAIEAAFDSANDTPYGLQAGIFTSSLELAMRASDRLEFGGVLVNETPSFRADHMPYGGTAQSGNTKEGPGHAVREMTDERLVVLRVRKPTPD